MIPGPVKSTVKIKSSSAMERWRYFGDSRCYSCVCSLVTQSKQRLQGSKGYKDVTMTESLIMRGL